MIQKQRITGKEIKAPQKILAIKKKRCHYFVMIKFQLRMIVSTASLIVLFSLVASGLLTYVTEQNYQSNVLSLQVLTEKLKTEDNIVQSFIKYAGSMSSRIYELRTDKIKTDHEESMLKLNSSITELRSSMEKSRKVVRYLYVVMVVQLLSFIILITKLSHRIAAPIHIMTKILNDLDKRKKPNLRDIRRNDEFREFYGLFIRRIERMINHTPKPVIRKSDPLVK